MNWKNILKDQRPDYPDLDGDGDTEEPMVDALETVEQVESVEKKEDNTLNTLFAVAIEGKWGNISPKDDGRFASWMKEKHPDLLLKLLLEWMEMSKDEFDEWAATDLLE